MVLDIGGVARRTGSLCLSLPFHTKCRKHDAEVVKGWPCPWNAGPFLLEKGGAMIDRPFGVVPIPATSTGGTSATSRAVSLV